MLYDIEHRALRYRRDSISSRYVTSGALATQMGAVHLALIIRSARKRTFYARKTIQNRA